MADGRGGRTLLGWFIHTKWGQLNTRCANGLYRVDVPKNAAYKNVYIRFTREEFAKWCSEREDVIRALNRPSIDRIDKMKDYELGNIQIIELIDNITKDKVSWHDRTHGTCRKCGVRKALEEFIVQRCLPVGRISTCRECYKPIARAKSARHRAARRSRDAVRPGIPREPGHAP